MIDEPQDMPLHHKVLIGLGAGVLIGYGANASTQMGWFEQTSVAFVADAIAYPIGQIFLRLLFLVVVPLVFASLAVGVANLGDLRKVGRIGAATMAFFLMTTAFSVVLGMLLMHSLQPGSDFDPATRESLRTAFAADVAAVGAKASLGTQGSTLETASAYLDLFLPRNVLKAVVDMQMLPLIVLALFFGIALTLASKAKREGMVGWLETVAEAMVQIVGIAMKLAPYAVACLVFAVVAKFGLELLQKLAFFVVIVLAAYLVQLFVFYPLILSLLARRKPVDFLRRAVPVMVTAFSTSSSNATLPTSIRVASQDLGIRPAVAGFVLPLGATMNMNGTALYEGAVVLFVAQVFGIELSISQQCLVLLLCVFSAIGAAGVPGGALPLIMTVMAQVGVPPEGLAIVLGVDRLLDMGRTVINVMGDMVCASWIERLEAKRAA